MEDFLKKEVISYFKDIDFKYWEVRLSHILSKLKTSKTDKAKSLYLVDCYSVYLQLLEIFFINILSLSAKEKTFFHFLFIGNKELRIYVETYFLDKEFQKWLMENYVFGLKDKSRIKNYEKRYAEHINIIKECVKDYLEDYDFLNAYKHGFRAKALFGDMKISIGGYKILQGDSKLTYYSQKENSIFKRSITFNHKRILGKSFFVLEMLKNAQKVFLAQGNNKKMTLNHCYIKDIEDWNKSFGTARFKTEILILKGKIRLDKKVAEL
jgi:hypothetical protein